MRGSGCRRAHMQCASAAGVRCRWCRWRGAARAHAGQCALWPRARRYRPPRLGRPRMKMLARPRRCAQRGLWVRAGPTCSCRRLRAARGRLLALAISPPVASTRSVAHPLTALQCRQSASGWPPSWWATGASWARVCILCRAARPAEAAVRANPLVQQAGLVPACSSRRFPSGLRVLPPAWQSATEGRKNQRTQSQVALRACNSILVYATEPLDAATFTPLACMGGLGLQGSRLRLRPQTVQVACLALLDGQRNLDG